jgi:hypothetical protein
MAGLIYNIHAASAGDSRHPPAGLATQPKRRHSHLRLTLHFPPPRATTALRAAAPLTHACTVTAALHRRISRSICSRFSRTSMVSARR